MKTHLPASEPTASGWDVESAPSFAPPAFQLRTQDSAIQRETEGDMCGVTSPQWQEFALGFNDKFQSLLHMFQPGGDAAESGTPTTARYSGAGNQSGDMVPPENLSCLFTVEQRDQLLDFFSTNVIPDRLFNGDDPGPTSAQQRILLSGIILSEGVYEPGSFLQQVHARMCGHWVKLVWHYAGATPSGNAEWGGVYGNLDHDGNVVLGNGRQESVYSGLGRNRTYLSNLPDGERDLHVPEGTRYAEAYFSGDEERQDATHRNRAMDFEDFGRIQPGDWLYYFNGNGSASGDHSVMFSRWNSDVQEIDGIRYRQAVALSQPNPARGGVEHLVNLGSAFRDADPKICPVTKVSRVAPDAQPADTVADVLGTVSEGEDLNRTNQQYLRTFRRRHGGEMDLERLRESLREENNRLIEELVALDSNPAHPEGPGSGRDRFTAGQEALLREANGEDHVENLVRLTQRLRAILSSVRAYDANIQRTYVTGRPATQRRQRRAGLNDQYETNHRETEARVTELQAQIDEIDLELGPTQQEIDRIEGQLDELGHVGELRQIRNRLNETWTQVRALPVRSPERNALMAERRELIARKEELQGMARGSREEVGELQAELAPLKRAVRPLERRRARLERQIGEAQATDPWGHAHPGNNKTDVDRRHSFNGNIEEVRPVATSGEFAILETRVE